MSFNPNPSYYKHVVSTAILDCESYLQQIKALADKKVGLEGLCDSESDDLLSLRAMFCNEVEDNLLSELRVKRRVVSKGGGVISISFNVVLRDGNDVQSTHRTAYDALMAIYHMVSTIFDLSTGKLKQVSD